MPLWPDDVLSVALLELGPYRRPSEEYLSAVAMKHTPDEAPLASAFVNWCCREAGFGGTNGAMARTWLRWGAATQSRLGAVTVIRRGEPGSNQAHVGFFIQLKAAKLYLLAAEEAGVEIRPYSTELLISQRVPMANFAAG
jgi:uncharacterized protein (TIGR02594 family)